MLSEELVCEAEGLNMHGSVVPGWKALINDNTRFHRIDSNYLFKGSTERLGLISLEDRFEHLAVQSKGLFCWQIYPNDVVMTSEKLPEQTSLQPQTIYFTELQGIKMVIWVLSKSSFIVWKCEPGIEGGIYQALLENVSYCRFPGALKILNDKAPYKLMLKVSERIPSHLWGSDFGNHDICVSILPLDNTEQDFYFIDKENIIEETQTHIWLFMQSWDRFGLLKVNKACLPLTPLFAGSEHGCKEQLTLDPVFMQCRRNPQSQVLSWEERQPSFFEKNHMDFFLRKISERQTLAHLPLRFPYFKEFYELSHMTGRVLTDLTLNCPNCFKVLGRTFRFLKGEHQVILLGLSKADAEQLIRSETDFKLEGQSFNIYKKWNNVVETVSCKCGAPLGVCINSITNLFCLEETVDSMCKVLASQPDLKQAESFVTSAVRKDEVFSDFECQLSILRNKQLSKQILFQIVYDRLMKKGECRLLESEEALLVEALMHTKHQLDVWAKLPDKMSPSTDPFINLKFIRKLQATGEDSLISLLEKTLANSAHSHVIASLHIALSSVERLPRFKLLYQMEGLEAW